MANNSASDKFKSGVSKAKGEIKDQVGNATDDKDMQRDGKKDKVKGEFQENVGKAKDNR
ncbi:MULTISPECIES: CsbD family protein [Bacillaceae]|uniref:CsbD family protein n=1 Tax=Bacillaceae TaxID=186817 RepID=UPI0009F89AD7|nr:MULTISPECIES: CsbD family protein [Bacillaceae]